MQTGQQAGHNGDRQKDSSFPGDSPLKLIITKANRPSGGAVPDTRQPAGDHPVTRGWPNR
jgi:hypothetical protein